MTMTTRTLARGPRSAQIIPLAAIATGLAILAVFAVTGLGAGGAGGNGNGGIGAPGTSASLPPGVSPSALASADPTDAPSEAPSSPAPTPTPTDGGTDAMPIKVDLDNVSGADVYVDIADRTGLLVSAESGKPAEGQSVAPYALEVENLDATTLKLTWVDYPIDNALALYIDEHDRGIRLLLVQPQPTGPTDSIALDRELVLSFSKPISADTVEAFLQDGLDTSG